MRFIFVKIPVAIVKIALFLVVLGIPLLGFWLVSSLAAYLNGPLWLPLVAGVLILPVLPLLWEWRSHRKWKRREHYRDKFLKFGDRMILRTLSISLIFIGLLLVISPQRAFLALATRGDWVLDHHQIRDRLGTEQQEQVQSALFTMAGGLEWLYDSLHHNPYQKFLEGTSESGVKPEPTRQKTDVLGTQQTRYETDYGGWPWQTTELHAAVVDMPPAAEESISSVAQFLAQAETDPFLRVKALHDYVADRVSYDAAALQAGEFPPQDARTVFRTRKSVCAGYANLLSALGKEVGEEIVVIAGDARNQGADMAGGGHAWNAAKIKDSWYLIDATWDSGYVNSFSFTKRYSTDYLFPPPQIIAVTHFPENQDWQLLPTPLSRGEFLRQPWLKPSFFAEGLRLVTPTRSQTDVVETATIKLLNPSQQWMMAKFSPKGQDPTTDCVMNGTVTTSFDCNFQDSGTYEVTLYSSEVRYGTYHFLGKLEFNNRP